MKKSVFIVDDDNLFATLLADHLNDKGGYEVTTFPTGEACLQRLSEKPDVVVLDYYLDSEVHDAKNGLEILKVIHKQYPDQKVIMLSGQEHYGVALQTIASGAIYYVLKELGSFGEIDSVLDKI